MKERPILFSGAMVRAILAGTKTQTRRACLDQSSTGYEYVTDMEAIFAKKPTSYTGWAKSNNSLPFLLPTKCPYGAPGDRLWVREAWRLGETNPNGLVCSKYAVLDGPDYWRVPAPVDLQKLRDYRYSKLRPSIHMPRWASRITLEIVSVHVERLQDISREDAIAEGIGAWDALGWPNYLHPERRTSSPIQTYETLWESINGPGSWEKNPWVWVVEFKRV